MLGEKDSLALSPDGHGGSLRALDRSGALADMRKRGVEHLSYFQVDNPLVHCVDPLFLGLHALTGSEMSSKTIPKAGRAGKGRQLRHWPTARCRSSSTATCRMSWPSRPTPDGSLRFDAGSIAIHVLAVSFVERLNHGGQLKLPWHRAEKKVPFVDDDGRGGEAGQAQRGEAGAVRVRCDSRWRRTRSSTRPTGRRNSRPVKNAEGTDSPATCARDQVRRAARWLRVAGVEVPEKGGEPDAKLEISPLYATSEEQLRERSPQVQVKSGAEVYLGG